MTATAPPAFPLRVLYGFQPIGIGLPDKSFIWSVAVGSAANARAVATPGVTAVVVVGVQSVTDCVVGGITKHELDDERAQETNSLDIM